MRKAFAEDGEGSKLIYKLLGSEYLGEDQPNGWKQF